MTQVKLCGLAKPADIVAANALNPEYIGFVFAPKSKRYVPLRIAQALKQKLDPVIKAVGVFVDEPVEVIAQLATQNIIDLVQLHGQEDEVYLARLREIVALPVIKAFEYLARTEGIIPAIESAHAVAQAMKMAGSMEKDNLLVITIFGRGDKDCAAIARYRGEDIHE